jgi:hypothetical protein
VGVANTYPGLIQTEAVLVHVTDAAGVPVTQGEVTFRVNDQVVIAPVVNGYALATIATPLLDFGILLDLVFAHPLSADFTNGGPFGDSSTGTTVPGLIIDFFFSQIALELQHLNQAQLPQFQSF